MKWYLVTDSNNNKCKLQAKNTNLAMFKAQSQHGLTKIHSCIEITNQKKGK